MLLFGLFERKASALLVHCKMFNLNSLTKKNWLIRLLKASEMFILWFILPSAQVVVEITTAKDFFYMKYTDVPPNGGC